MISEKLVLKRRVKVEFYECLATIRRKEASSYIVSVLKLAKRYGRITPERLRDELLPEEALILSENIIRRYTQLGFINERGEPTDLGNEAASGNVLMPESGKYIIGVTEDPLITCGIVYIKRVSDGNQNTNSTKPDGEDKRTKSKKPEILSRVINNLSLVWIDDKIQETLVESIEDVVYPCKIDIHFKMEMVMDKNNTSISLIKDKGAPINLPNDSEMDFEEIWNLHIKRAGLEWWGSPLNKGKALMNYNETDLSERKSFSKNIPLKEILTSHSGRFEVDPIVINIQPSNDIDATLWAKELITSEITGYCDESRYTEISERVRKKFTESFPNIPNIEEFLEYLYGTVENTKESLPIEYWYLRAPRDLVPVVK